MFLYYKKHGHSRLYCVSPKYTAVHRSVAAINTFKKLHLVMIYIEMTYLTVVNEFGSE